MSVGKVEVRFPTVKPSTTVGVVRAFVSSVRHLVGVAEIAEMLGVTRQRVNQLIKEAADFPTPEAELSAGRIWRRDAVEEWARRTGRL